MNNIFEQLQNTAGITERPKQVFNNSKSALRAMLGNTRYGDDCTIWKHESVTNDFNKLDKRTACNASTRRNAPFIVASHTPEVTVLGEKYGFPFTQTIGNKKSKRT
jgi:hypothetical protein